MNARDARPRIIKEIEQIRGSKLLIYFCGDRPICPANIASDAIRPLYDHLLALSHAAGEERIETIDLFLYGIGGRLEVPWRIVTMIREFCKNFNVIIPYKAYSAATLIALGADKIIMGRKGELSPIDPTLHVVVPEGAPPPSFPREIGVEDISSYVTFMKERVGLTDQDALVQTINILADKLLTPVILGQVQRAYSHIRLIARKLLALCRPPLEESRITEIVEALTEKIYLHGHGIGRKEAKELGLRVEEPDPQLEKLIWDLYLAYEELLKMRTTADAYAYLGEADEYREPDTIIACIESTEKFHVYKGELRIRRVRKLPPNPVINVNLNIQLPPGLRLEEIPARIQQEIQMILQRAASIIREQVIKELARQAMGERIERRLTGGMWVEVV